MGDKEDNIAKRAPFQELSAEERERLAGIAAATPRETKANGKPEAAGAWADRLKQKNPGLTAAQAAAIVGATEGDIAKRAPFLELSAEERERLAGIAAATPRETKANGKPEAAGAWADRLKQKNPGLTAAQAAAIVGATEGEIAKGAVPGAVGRGAREAGRERGGDAAGDESQRQARGGRGLGGSAVAEEPGPHRRAGRSHRGGPGKQYRSKGAVPGAVGRGARGWPGSRRRRRGRRKANGKPEAAGAWADRLKQKNPGLTAAQAAAIVGDKENNIAQRAPFQELSAEERERLAGIAAATPRETKANGKPEAAGAWADRLRAEEPGPHRRAGRSHRGGQRKQYRSRAPFQELSAEERERLAGIAAATPRETKANGKPEAAGAWADRLKQKNPGLTAAQAAAIVGAREGDIAKKGAVPGAVGRGAREAGRDRGGDAAGDESQRQARGGRGLGGSAEAEEPGPHRRAGRSHRGGDRGDR